MIIDLNGKNMESTQPVIGPFDRGLALGDGIFETIRIKNFIPQFFNLHMERFFTSASFLNISIEVSKKEIEARIINLLELNNE